MDYGKMVLDLLRSQDAHLYAHRALEALGVMTILPKVLAKATPWAMKAADRVADVALRIPLLREVILLFGDDIVATLEAVSNGIEGLIDTFARRLEERVKQAKAAEDFKGAGGQPIGGVPTTHTLPDPTPPAEVPKP